MASSTVTAKGQTTVPASVRAHFNIKPGACLQWIIDEDGAVSIVPVTSPIASLRGMVKHVGEPVSLEQMDEAIAAGASE